MTGIESAERNLNSLAEGDALVLETLAEMTLDTMKRSGLPEETYLLVRIAALVAMDAAPVSYLMNVGTALEAGIPMETLQGTLIAIAPVVGSARIMSAASKMVRALAMAEEEDEQEEEDELNDL